MNSVSTNALQYRRVLLKVSGEALAGADGILDFTMLNTLSLAIKKATALGAQIAVVIGAGNIWRGRQGGGMDRTRADHMGMLATVINSIALQDSLIAAGVPAKVVSALKMEPFAEYYSKDLVDGYLNAGQVVIFSCGTGSPYFSTDTGAVLRGAQIGADALLFAKNVDGVYTADPRVDKNAKKIDAIRYEEILSKHLAVIDPTAAALAMENKLRIFLFALSDPDNILRVLTGEAIGTVVTSEKA